MKETLQKIPSEFFVAAAVLGAVLVMLVPLPSLLLDMFLVLNMCLAFLLVMLAMSTEDTSQLSVFPTLVLGMTLGRLVLNVASTRLILTQGTSFGGVIVKAFGSFVVGGSYGVGVILFLVLVCIQVMVVSKGSERVAEVAARFALDGLSSKQVGIESRAQDGGLTPEEAEIERRSLQQKADFFGSMDGASKYVKGENMAGLLITIINFFGGVVLAIFRGGSSPSQLIETYALLTVGDGLVGLVPSMLLAVATGLVITKTEGDGTLGARVMDEFFQSYRAAGVSFLGVGLFVTVLGVFSGVDPLGFLVLSVLCFSVSALFFMATEAVDEAWDSHDPSHGGVQVHLAESLLEALHSQYPGGLEAGMQAASKELAKTLGVKVAPPEWVATAGLDESCWDVLIHEVSCGGGRLDPHRILALYPGEAPGERLPGEPDEDPTGNRPAQLISPEARIRAADLGCDLLDPTELLGLRVSKILISHARDLFGQDETEKWLREAQERFPAVVREARSAHKGPEIKALLAGLLAEGVAIRQPRPILEALSQLAGHKGRSLVEAVRGHLGKQIVGPLKTAEGTLPTLTLVPAVEAELKGCMREGEDGGIFLDVPFDLAQDLLSGARARSQGMRKRGFTPCLLVSRGLRPHLYQFLVNHIFDLRVLAYDEAGRTPIQNMGRLGRFEPEPRRTPADQTDLG